MFAYTAAVDKQGKTPLMLAAVNNKYAMVLALERRFH